MTPGAIGVIGRATPRFVRSPTRSLPAQNGVNDSATSAAVGKRFGGTLGQHPVENGHQWAGHVRPNLVDRHNVFVGVGHDFSQEGAMPLVAKRRPSRQEEIESTTQGVHVGPGIGISWIRALFRGHVVRTPHDLTTGRSVTITARLDLEPGQSQIKHLDNARGRQHEVRWFDIPMNKAMLVGVLQPNGSLPNDVAGIGNIQWPNAAHQRRQGDSLDELHHEKELAVSLTRIVGTDDVRVIDPAHGFHFPMKANHRLWRSLPVGRQQFDSNSPFQLGVESLVNGPHAALAQLFDEPVLANLLGKDCFVGRDRANPSRTPM